MIQSLALVLKARITHGHISPCPLEQQVMHWDCYTQLRKLFRLYILMLPHFLDTPVQGCLSLLLCYNNCQIASLVWTYIVHIPAICNDDWLAAQKSAAEGWALSCLLGQQSTLFCLERPRVPGGCPAGPWTWAVQTA